MKYLKFSSLTALFFLFLSGTAIAQESDWETWPLADNVTLVVDAFFPNLDTKVRLDATDGSPGTTIDFEQNLGMNDTEALAGGGIAWRFSKRHKVKLERFQLNRSGSAIAATDIRFGDEVFTINLPISSFFDMRVTGVNYSYSLIFDEKKEFTVGLGLSVQDFEFGIRGNGNTGLISAQSGITAPVPTLDLRGAYAFTDKWIGRAGLGVFSFAITLESEDNLSGDVLNAFAAIEHKTFENVHFGLSYAYFDVGVDFDSESRLTSMGYQYNGPMISVIGAF